MKMLILRGLPASGKSTRAEEVVKNSGWYRVNRDSLRAMLHFDKWTPLNEKMTVAVAESTVKTILAGGGNVIIDDTNLTEKHLDKWKHIALEFGATYTVEDMMKKTTLAECLRRDELRQKPVGKNVIMDMAMQYGYADLGRIVVCDIDGTIADIKHRLEHVHKEKKDWGTFFSLMFNDTPRMDVFSLVKNACEANDAYLVYVSARPDRYRSVTEEWLKVHGLDKHVHLIMRRGSDSRPDTEVKSDIYNQYLSKYQVVEVFDDRPSVIRMWREKGLMVTDVGEGKEF